MRYTVGLKQLNYIYPTLAITFCFDDMLDFLSLLFSYSLLHDCKEYFRIMLYFSFGVCIIFLFWTFNHSLLSVKPGFHWQEGMIKCVPLGFAKDLQPPGPNFCLLLGASSDYVQPITVQVTEVTGPVIGPVHPELTPTKRHITGFDAKACGPWMDPYFHLLIYCIP